jgi:hypothetical protein
LASAKYLKASAGAPASRCASPSANCRHIRSAAFWDLLRAHQRFHRRDVWVARRENLRIDPEGSQSGRSGDAPTGLQLVDLAPGIADFDDTAAILSLADLLISVDSSPIRLAGALGRPGWALLPFLPDWRRLIGRDDSPWYPTMRLFRQPRPGDWAAALARVAAAFRDDPLLAAARRR